MRIFAVQKHLVGVNFDDDWNKYIENKALEFTNEDFILDCYISSDEIQRQKSQDMMEYILMLRNCGDHG